MPEYTNSFKTSVYHEETIVGADGKLLGIIRVKPSGVLWKPNGSSRYYSVSLKFFIDWITATETKARRTTS